jgi:hypothetical protein
VTEPAASPKFAWIYKRDGRLVPFEADKISQALFAAGESMGRPDAFMARELTDSILHFLAAEADGPIPTTTQVAEVVTKVVRELGQPALARTFADGRARRAERRKTPTPTTLPSATPGVGPSLSQLVHWANDCSCPAELARRAAGACLRAFTLHEVFTRDLVAAQADGLLVLTGLETPLELAGCVLPAVTTGNGLVEAVAQTRSVAGQFLVLDGPEYILAGRGANEVQDFTQALHLSLRVATLQAVVNLNSAAPPAPAGDLAMGPLFAGHRQAAEPEQRGQVLKALLDQLLQPGTSGASLRVDWHLGPADFLPAASATLLRLARRALEGSPLAFVFDRPRRSVSLAEGLDRQHPALLLSVGLDLPRLLEQIRPPVEPATYLQKLGSLARLALSAAKQKRDFLRRHRQGRPALTGGFLLERARLNVVPLGLDAATRTVTGEGLCAGGTAAEYARQVVQRLRDVLREDGRASLLDTCLDAWPAGATTEPSGLTPWDTTAAAKNQLRAAGPLHAVAEAGTVTVLDAEGRPSTAAAVVDLLRYAGQQTDVVRVRFARHERPAQPLTAIWEKGSDLPQETRS